MTTTLNASLALADWLKINANDVKVVDERDPIELEANEIGYFVSKTKITLISGYIGEKYGFKIYKL